MKNSWEARSLTGSTFAQLLAAFGENREEAAAQLEAIRQRLEKYFAWERFADADELAWECLLRVAQKLAENVEIDNVEAYVFGVARMVLQEARSTQMRRQRLLSMRPADAAPDANLEQHAAALERCLRLLPEADRELILRYYEGDSAARIRNRQNLAHEHGLSLNALRNKALRLRTMLERCFHSRVRLKKE